MNTTFLNITSILVARPSSSEISCIAKGKEHKPYELESKVSFDITRTTNVIVSVATFKGNPYDGNTLKETLKIHKRMTGIQAKKTSVDRGYLPLSPIIKRRKGGCVSGVGWLWNQSSVMLKKITGWKEIT